ncbi:hypothetical protein SISSUDRAFT_1129871 [Sistotremastrum suecicum HHB10207 ss-3]|uniref:Uncharacterized protein n=1 Tax=Sistotremastrum suecicum HHB10207 ss-3 TaxID=1314776 RepID=A0A166C4U9_9AGAM|nr:hypothetical protein SISSUDRAFT_1129871 [Sistotremastrum suecicum HHB10207 ss-3]
MPRALSLHPSALSPSEFKTFVPELYKIAGFESAGANVNAEEELNEELLGKAVVGVRELRGWLMGRLEASLDFGVIDQILRFFSPELAPSDVLSSGQFFAALRLVSHAQASKDVDPELVFIQWEPFQILDRRSPSPQARPFHSPKNSISLTRRASGSNPFTRSPSQHSVDRRPLDDEASLGNQSAPAHITRSTFATPPHPPPPASAITSPSLNPFHSKARTTISSPAATPPLPPRKESKPLLPPPRHSSILTGSSSSIASPNVLTSPPSKPPKHPRHVPSPLMQQSLTAARTAKLQLEADKSMQRERQLEVISRTGERRETSPPKPPSHPSYSRPPPPSSISSSSNSSQSLSQSGAYFQTPSPFRTTTHPPSSPPKLPHLPLVSPFDSPPLPPLPTGPRPSRSKSLEQPSTPPPSAEHTEDVTPLPPPPRRKRPESAQIFPSGFAASTDPPPYSSSIGSNQSGNVAALSRHLSLSAAHARHPPNPLNKSNIQKTLTRIQSRAEHARDSLLPQTRTSRDGADERLFDRSEGYEGLPDDSSSDDGLEDVEGLRHGVGNKERDTLKMPVGGDEGWRRIG